MSKYVDILLTQDGVFCVAPPWTVNIGDLVSLPDEVKGADKICEVVSVATDKNDGEHIKQIEKYFGYPLPKVTAKYSKSEVDWNAPLHE